MFTAKETLCLYYFSCKMTSNTHEIMDDVLLDDMLMMHYFMTYVNLLLFNPTEHREQTHSHTTNACTWQPITKNHAYIERSIVSSRATRKATTTTTTTTTVLWSQVRSTTRT